MERKSIVLMSLLTLVPSSIISGSYIDAKLKKPKHDKFGQSKNKSKKNNHRISASVLMPKQAAEIIVDRSIYQASYKQLTTEQTIAVAPALAPQESSDTPVQASSSSSIKKTPFPGLYHRNIAKKWWYGIPYYQCAHEELEAFDPETQEWQNTKEDQAVITNSLPSFKKHRAFKALKEFLVIARNKKISLPPLDDTQTWLREVEITDNAQKKAAGDCLSVIGMINKQSDNLI